MFIRRVKGRSMLPALVPEQVVIGRRRHPRTGDIVLARQGTREVLKRVRSIKDGKAYLVGDNGDESQDSRHYGPVEFQDIIGSIMIKLPHAIDPPKLVKPYGVWFGRVAAAIIILMAVVHLFRIDTLIPILDSALPGGMAWATFYAVVIVLTEVFAIPFALRMKLSLLAHFKSGALVAFAPLWWLLISIWSLDAGVSTGQFGQFVDTPSTTALVLLNFAWVGFNYATLWLLGYNRLSLKKLLSK